MAPELDDKTNGKEKNKLPHQNLGEVVGTTYAHPWFLPRRRPRQHFSSFLTLTALKVFIGMSV